MPRSKKAESKQDFRFAPKDRDLPATQGMLQLVRSELKSEMRAGFKKVDARFAQVDRQFAQVDRQFAQVHEEFAKIHGEMAHLHSSVAELSAQVSRMAIAVEEQNSRNRVVMDGLSGLWDRQDRVEKKVDGFEEWIRSLSRTSTQ